METFLSVVIVIGGLVAFAKWYIGEVKKAAHEMTKELEQAASRRIDQFVGSAEGSAKRVINHFEKVAKDPGVQKTTENIAIACAAIAVIGALAKDR